MENQSQLANAMICLSYGLHFLLVPIMTVDLIASNLYYFALRSKMLDVSMCLPIVETQVCKPWCGWTQHPHSCLFTPPAVEWGTQQEEQKQANTWVKVKTVQKWRKEGRGKVLLSPSSIIRPARLWTMAMLEDVPSPTPRFLSLSMKLHSMEYPFSRFVSAVPPLFPPKSLPTPRVANKKALMLCRRCSAVAKTTGVLSNAVLVTNSEHSRAWSPVKKVNSISARACITHLDIASQNEEVLS